MWQQLASQQSQDSNIDKLLRFQRFKIRETETKIERVREGFEAGPPLYSLSEAQRRIAIHQETISKAKAEIKRLEESNNTITQEVDIRDIIGVLQQLRDRNLDDAPFDDKLELISRLGLKVYPAEDLKSMKVLCGVNLRNDSVKQIVNNSNTKGGSEPTDCGIVSSAPPTFTICKTSAPRVRLAGGSGKVYSIVIRGSSQTIRRTNDLRNSLLSSGLPTQTATER